jgi:microcystin-dependent protein
MGVAITLETTGSSITNAYGGWFGHLSSGTVTNGYGVYVAQVAGTNKWNFYGADATSASYFNYRAAIGSNPNPQEELQVETTSNTGISVISNTNSTLSFGTSSNHFMGAIRYDNTNNSMNFWTNNTANRLTINNVGNVGIGTATANAPLQFANTIASRKIVLWDNNNNDHQFYGLGINNGVMRYQVDITSADHIFYSAVNSTTSNELMRIRGTGRVGITNPNPSTTFGIGNGATEKFTINGTDGDMNFLDDQGSITFSATTGTPAPMINIYSSGISNSDRMVISHSPSYTDYGLQYQDVPDKFVFLGFGNPVLTADLNNLRVGVGTATPTAKFHVEGSTRLVDGNQANGKVLTSDASGNATWQALTPVPAGGIIAYGGTAVPTGWFICDGSAVSRTTYATLFAAIGTAWGSGDGSTTFNLPDMRGMFLRGVDGTASVDPDKATRTANNAGGNTGNNVGSEQSYQVQSHNHTMSNHGNTSNASLGLGSPVYVPSGSSTTTNTGGNETRPTNVYVYYIIKQ